MTLKMGKHRQLVAQSEIRNMTLECAKVGGVNLAQGVCDLPVPDEVVAGAEEAMRSGFNTYTRYDGLPRFREAIAAKQKRYTGMDVDPDSQVVVSAGATGAFYATCLALLDEGDEVLVFEPYYGYHVTTLASLGVTSVPVVLEPPEWAFTADDLERAITKKTRAILVNTPSNPAGKVFTREELTVIAACAEAHDLFVFTDEIYEHFVFDGREHISPATLPGMARRTITISGLSKVFAVTGWRLGYAVCDPEWALAIGHFSDLVYICAPAPLQVGAARGLERLGPEYYQGISDDHQLKRDLFCQTLEDIGLTPHRPQGAYYTLADVTALPGRTARERAMFLLEKTGVACVPGSAFYSGPTGETLARFCFAKQMDALEDAMTRLRGLQL
ncbi:aminotransferase class I/II-fold pyridoxal phosphate-dependent enzyme [Pseudodesulfovibrio sp. JC047]|uniref:pyridoxal phosphate-dependent aminotransferase n=1 Tax=Pseudodesulfovibrio sp. JC047 TaxID=2683199 RepID=UPI0013D2E216|nr:aminotransferase class I/II-fold pyridoxal phosphate-dependent enzyme [Pseudodesulfovibrio sp. JC047]NDV19682.1 aminotransferase class I/II-fold pyridoxal phosphate-dependent enzyme [Pseudodesulfovibrio sp. JC047]